MKRFSRILFYLKNQKGKIGLYVVFNLLSVIFSLVSFAMVPVFLQMLFGKEKILEAQPVWSFSANGIFDYVKYFLGQLIRQHGQIYALGFICVMIIISVF